MNTKERLLAIKLSEKIDRNPEYAKKVGISEKKEGEKDGKKIKVSHMAEKGL